MKKEITGQQVVDEARKWLGTPWRHVGRNEHGIDCIGLGVVVAKSLGVQVQDMLTYGREPNATLLGHFYGVANEVPLSDARVGDFYVIKDGPYPFHIAFISEIDGVRHIIHANARMRKTIEEPYTDHWVRLTTHAFRLKAVKNA